MIGLTNKDVVYATHKMMHTAQCENITPELLRERVFNFNLHIAPTFTAKGDEIPNFYHLEDDNGDSVPSAALSKNFGIVQHHEILDCIENDILPNVPDARFEFCGTMYGRSTSVFGLEIGSQFSVEGDESPNTTRLFISNPTNGKGSLVLGFTMMRLFCTNQLMAARSEASKGGLRIVHTLGAKTRLVGCMEKISKGLQIAAQMKDLIGWLARREVSVATVGKALDAVYPMTGLEEGTRAYTVRGNARNEVLANIETDDTFTELNGWTLYNAFTHNTFNPTTMRKNTDSLDIQYRGMAGNIGMETHSLFGEIVDIVKAA